MEKKEIKKETKVKSQKSFDKQGWILQQRDIFKFENVGDTVIGFFKGFKDLPFKNRGIILSSNSIDKIVPETETLKNLLTDLDLEKEIAIEYNGETKSGKGKTYKVFNLYRRQDDIDLPF